MTVRALVKPSEYHDSVSLMLVARELSNLDGVQDAAVVMATEANKSILTDAGLLTDEAKSATPNDLLIAVSAEKEFAGRGGFTKSRCSLEEENLISPGG